MTAPSVSLSQTPYAFRFSPTRAISTAKPVLLDLIAIIICAVSTAKNVVPVHTIEAQLQPFLPSAPDVGNFMSRRRYPRHMNSGLIDQGAGWAPERFWTISEKKKTLALAGIQTLHRPAHSQSLYHINR